VTSSSLNLDNRDNWSKVYANSFYADPIGGTDKFTPIPTVRIPGIFDKHILALELVLFRLNLHGIWDFGYLC